MGGITHLSGDDIYATNDNRTYCRTQGIVHSFKRKGRAGKYEDQYKELRSILRKERATRMEGSFGTEKEYYGLQKIKTRTKKMKNCGCSLGYIRQMQSGLPEKWRKLKKKNEQHKTSCLPKLMGQICPQNSS